MTPYAAKSTAGFTLLEVLVAMAITLTIVGLTMQAYDGALMVNEAVEMLAETNQNLQAGATYMQQDLTKAGQNMPLGGIVIPNGAGAIPPRIPVPAPATWRSLPGTGALYAVVPGDDLGPTLSDDTESRSDVITVSYVDDAFPLMTLVDVDANVTQATVLNDGSVNGVRLNDGGRNKLVVGDLLVIYGTGSIIHEVTGMDLTNPLNQKLFFETSTAGSANTRFNQPGATSGGLTTLKNGDGEMPPLTARLLKMVTYYIARPAEGTDAEHPALMRQINARPAQPIALDVENLQLTYFIYSKGEPLAELATPPAGKTPDDIRKVRLYLAARSDAPSRKTKRYVRNTTQTQITIRSLGLSDSYR